MKDSSLRGELIPSLVEHLSGLFEAPEFHDRSTDALLQRDEFFAPR